MTEAAKMEFSARDMAKGAVSKAKADSKVQAKAGSKAFGREDVIKWGGIVIKKVR